MTARPISTSGGQSGGVRTIVCAQREDCAFDLPTGTWSIHAEADAYWVPERVAIVRPTGAVIDLPFFPTGQLAGTFVAGGDKPPTALAMTFQSAGDPDAFPARPPSPPEVAGEARCAVSEQSWHCILPAVPLDIRIHAQAYVPRYLWKVAVRPGETTKTAPISMRRGASLFGSVQLPREAKRRPEGVLVTLVPAGKLPLAQQATLTMAAKTNAKGFFQFEGIPPGEFAVTAKTAQWASDPVPVTILDNREAQLSEPLLLDTAKRLTLSISPPLDPAGHPWGIQWGIRQGQMGTIEGVTVASADGRWSKSDLRAGQFIVAVVDRAGNCWWEDFIDVRRDDLNISIAVLPLSLRGRVGLNGKPIAASLVLQSEGVSMRFASNEEGEFSGLVPSGVTEWDTVSVESKLLQISRKLRHVAAKRVEGDDTVLVEIDLPSTQVSGSVVDEQGVPAKWGIIDVHPLSYERDLSQTTLKGDGTFVINGLDPGDYRIQAHTHDADSESIAVRLGGAAGDPVVLTVRPRKLAALEVVSNSGPVPGATVTTIGVENPGAYLRTVTTDAAGIATIEVQGANAHVDVQVKAPGFAIRQFRMAKPEGAGVKARVTQISGQLRLLFPSIAEGSGKTPVVVHDRAVFSAFSLDIRGYGPQSEIVSMAVEPGPWALCLVTPAEAFRLRLGDVPAAACVSGLLAPGGELVLDKSAKR